MSDTPHQAAALGDLPADELRRYGQSLGLELPEGQSTSEYTRLIRQRQELLVELDRDALMDVIVWARRPIRKSATKEELAREITRIQSMKYDQLAPRGLAALARLRGIFARPTEPADSIIAKLRSNDGWWKRANQARRRLLGSIITRVVAEEVESDAEEYRFLPEEDGVARAAARATLKSHITERGVVGGIATRLRGAADDYIQTKLDEIEIRIDRKLEEIDKRLGEWRDREVANRLKILRLTLIFSVLVALLSLGYNVVKSRLSVEDHPSVPSAVNKP